MDHAIKLPTSKRPSSDKRRQRRNVALCHKIPTGAGHLQVDRRPAIRVGDPAPVAQPIWLCSYDPAPMGDATPRRTETAPVGGTANLAVLLRPRTDGRRNSKTDRNRTRWWHSQSGCALPHTHKRPGSKTDRNRTRWWHSQSGCALTTPHPWATQLQDGPKPKSMSAILVVIPSLPRDLLFAVFLRRWELLAPT